MIHNRPYYGKKITVVIPCKNRERSLIKTLPRWFEQIDAFVQVAIVDYDSSRSLYSLVKNICDKRGKTFAYNEINSNADCVLLRLENKPYFNMSHALNYGIFRTQSELISIAGTESSPSPYYFDIVTSVMDATSFTRCIRGRLTFPRHLIERINGYPELLEYWGGEDDVVASQFVSLGYKCIDVDYTLVDNIQNANFHNPIKGYWNEETSKFKHLENQDSSIIYRNNNIATRYDGQKLNATRMNHYWRTFDDKTGNNYWLPPGSENPILIQDSNYPSGVSDSISSPDPSGTCCGSRISVIIPCMDRIEHIRSSFPQWLEQLYQNKQIIFVDYNSKENVKEVITNICDYYHVSLCDMTSQEYDYNANVVYIKIPDMKFFNISHAYNYAVKHIKTDVLAFVCADSCPKDYYLDMVSHCVDDKTVVQVWWGIVTITYKNWKLLNGHQEFVIGWGGEDDDFIARAKLLGLQQIILSNKLIFCIPHDNNLKGINREVTDIWESHNINVSRLETYRAIFGISGNYDEEIGKEKPLRYKDSATELKVLHCYNIIDELELPTFFQKYTDHVYYFIQQDNTTSPPPFDKLGYVKYYRRVLVSTDNNIDKILKNIYEQWQK